MYTVSPTYHMVRFFGKNEKRQEQKPLQEVSIPDAITVTLNDPKIERAVLAYLSLQEQFEFGGLNPQDTPELNKRIETIDVALADAGIQLAYVATEYGVDDTLHSFITQYKMALSLP